MSRSSVRGRAVCLHGCGPAAVRTVRRDVEGRRSLRFVEGKLEPTEDRFALLLLVVDDQPAPRDRDAIYRADRAVRPGDRIEERRKSGRRLLEERLLRYWQCAGGSTGGARSRFKRRRNRNSLAGILAGRNSHGTVRADRELHFEVEDVEPARPDLQHQQVERIEGNLRPRRRNHGASVRLNVQTAHRERRTVSAAFERGLTEIETPALAEALFKRRREPGREAVDRDRALQ
jgi:hypothetical protein